MLLVAPPLFAATLYMLLGRIVLALNAKSYSLVNPRWLTKVIVTSDVICFLVQLGGESEFDLEGNERNSI